MSMLHTIVITPKPSKLEDLISLSTHSGLSKGSEIGSGVIVLTQRVRWLQFEAEHSKFHQLARDREKSA